MPDRRYRALLRVALVVVVLDQLTKALILSRFRLSESVSVIDGFLNLVHVRNPGAAFSLLAGAPGWFRGPFFVAVTLGAIMALLYVARRLDGHDRWLRVGLGGLLGGAVGNLIDRLLYGEVIDFIDVHWGDHHWPAFNVADSSISLAVAVVLLHSVFSRAAQSPLVGRDG